MKYIIQLNYISTITEVVEADDEGVALEKARSKAEEADVQEFSIREELESKIINI